MDSHAEEYGRYARMAVTAAAVTAVVLVFAKAFAWYMSGSASLLSSLVDSVLDSLSSIMTLLILRYSLQPPDEDHRFGHGKAEALAALGQSLITAVAGIVVIVESVRRVYLKETLERNDLSIGVMLLSISMTLALVLFQKRVIKKTNSMAVKADNLHYYSDLIANAGVIVAIVLEKYGVPYADAIGGVLVSFVILKAAREIFQGALKVLLDEQVPEDVLKRLVELIEQDKAIVGHHDLKTRMDGQGFFFQLHIEVCGEQLLHDAHEIAEELEQRIKKEWPNSATIVHLDPA